MHRLEESIEKPSTYSGELYPELHRGTLTNRHNIKRNNRLAEIAIRNLEYTAVRSALQKDAAADEKQIRPLLSTLLVNQFHDILPGTCIARAHDEAIAEVTDVIRTADEMTQKQGRAFGKKSGGRRRSGIQDPLKLQAVSQIDAAAGYDRLCGFQRGEMRDADRLAG